MSDVNDISEMWREEHERWKARRDRRMMKAIDELQMLSREGYTIAMYPNDHFKINGRLNVWPGTRRWWDEKRKIRGEIRVGRSLAGFIRAYFKEVRC